MLELIGLCVVGIAILLIVSIIFAILYIDDLLWSGDE